VLARLRRGERVDHFETVRRARDGRLVDMSITVSPIKDADGRIVGASKVGRDITERRKGETALRRLASVVESSDDVIREQDARRHHHLLEPGRRADLRLDGGGGGRAAHHADRPG